MNSNEHLFFAIKIAHEAEKILIKSLGKELNIKYKEGNFKDLVTEIDRAVEKFLIEKINQQYPNHGILSEESGQHGKAQKEYQWIIDPIDGTTNFSHGYPFFAISIALKKNEFVIAGVVLAPVLNEIYSAAKGKGAFLNGKPIHVSKIKDLKKSLLATGFGTKNKISKNLPYFVHFLKNAQAVRRAGSAALDLCHVACGKLDGFWEFGLRTWDIAAGQLIVEEAGGKITNTEGRELDLMKGNIIASNSLIHEKIVDVLKLDFSGSRRKNQSKKVSIVSKTKIG